MEQPTIESLIAERDKLKAELEALRGKKASMKVLPSPSESKNWTYRHRISLRNLFSRDNGEAYIGSTVAVAGWVKSVRLQGRDTFAFIKLSDGSSPQELQIVIDQATPGWNYVHPTHDVSYAASIFVIGNIIKSQGSGQKVELSTIELRLCGTTPVNEYPFSPQKQTVEYLRENGHLRPRTQLISSITRVRNALAYATHKYFQELGFYYVHTPIITASDCEGAGEMFQLTTLLMDKGRPTKKPSQIKTLEDGQIDYSEDFFKKPAYLTVSGQLNVESYACSMGSVYTFGPTFRAEYSFTARHLAEFWMIEPEIAFADLFENMEVAEGYVRYCLDFALDTCGEELAFLEKYEVEVLAEKKKEIAELMKKEEEERKSRGEAPQKKKKMPDVRGFKATPLRQRLQTVAKADFVRVTYTEAIDILTKSGVEFKEAPFWGMDMGSEHERWLAETYFKSPTIVYNYPKTFKAFYMRLNEDNKTVAAMDLLVPGVGELIGGSQREERMDVLLERLAEKGLEKESYKWYLDLRRFGSIVHSGFGLGFERLVCYTTGIENIREVMPFPRWPGHAEF
eukprot:TRINITY_DN333_c0_g1_i3.p1 TRINITY_DN333_c0_g1~~TRINITY_DN333_c0_g1_i3.p1  ORF type:complete len:567 (-),score=120.72 TRINITY_DN333_c0_g1_i3:155-1855(-)